jgi:hypothetical protein
MRPAAAVLPDGVGLLRDLLTRLLAPSLGVNEAQL